MSLEPARHDTAPPPLVFPFHHAPKPGKTIAVAPGVHWVRMPLPFALDHVNLWLLADGDGWTIVDTGLGLDDPTKALWLEVFAATLDGRPVKRVVVTHFHPDHMGLAGWLCERFEVALWISQAEWLTAHLARRGWSDADTDKRLDYYRRNGFAAAKRELDLGKGNHRGIPGANGLSDHTAGFQLCNQLVEVRQRLGQGGLGSRKQPAK